MTKASCDQEYKCLRGKESKEQKMEKQAKAWLGLFGAQGSVLNMWAPYLPSVDGTFILSLTVVLS